MGRRDGSWDIWEGLTRGIGGSCDDENRVSGGRRSLLLKSGTWRGTRRFGRYFEVIVRVRLQEKGECSKRWGGTNETSRRETYDKCFM